MPSTKKPDDLFEVATNADSDTEQPKRGRSVYYTSNMPDSYIKNAFSGHIYPYKVGSFDSLQLYKVMDSTGTVDKDGVKLSKTKRPNGSSNILYYDSPEEYMRHRRIKLDSDKINSWKNKVTRLFPKGEFSKTEWVKMKDEYAQEYTQEYAKRSILKYETQIKTQNRKRANSGIGLKCIKNN
tara:strand:- start:243 stop:788 length:546 start_codon:yes stop_codon:yes gene_type:complete